jgi:AraC family transcriptional regulator
MLRKEFFYMSYLDIFNELSEHINIKINSCNYMCHDANWIENKTHIDYDLWLILDGTITVEARGKILKAGAGDAVLFYPNIPYMAYTSENSCHFIYTHFDFGLGNTPGLLELFGLAGVIRKDNIADESTIYESTFKKYRLKASMSSMMLKGSFIMLLAAVIGSCDKRKYEDMFDIVNSKNKNTEKLTLLQPVLNYVSENIHRPLRIAELSKVAGISEKYFITFFKSILGITPGQYIYQLRMNRARDYLSRKKCSVKETALRLGYPDQFSFSKAFKRCYKIPPSEFV